MSRLRRRKGGGFRGPKRPLRWIYCGSDRDSGSDDGCAVEWVPIPCGVVGDPEAPLDFPSAIELIRGDTDLDFSDKTAPTVVRVVGDISIRGGATTAINPAGFTVPSFFYVPPVVRMGLVVADEIESTNWVPPDLWNPEDGQDVQWMWRGQFDLCAISGSPVGDAAQLYAASGGAANYATFPRTQESRTHHLDVRINRKIGRNGALVMCFQFGYFVPGFLGLSHEQVAQLSGPQCIWSNDLRALVKS